MLRLEKYKEYTRREAHEIFSPLTKFVPQAGTWGLQGIVRISPNENDFVFFVTFGRVQSEFEFDESITESGILTWQSQPGQDLKSRIIQDLIHYNHDMNSIYLFLRTKRFQRKGERAPYAYLGRLAYITHDPNREKPVHFKWQILDWEVTQEELNRVDLQLISDYQPIIKEVQAQNNQGLVETPKPVQFVKTSNEPTFHGRVVNFAENETRNKSIGLAGEALVVEHEKRYLIESGRLDLAEKVLHQSQVVGDGLGYDVLSWTSDGQPKYIEVKTTVGGIHTPFMLTVNELKFAQIHSKNYYLYRVYELDRYANLGKFFKIHGDLETQTTMEPTQFRVRL